MAYRAALEMQRPVQAGPEVRILSSPPVFRAVSSGEEHGAHNSVVTGSKPVRRI